THAGSGAADTVQPLLLTLESLARQLRSLPLSEQYSRLAGFQQQLVADLIQRLRALRVLCRPEPVTAGDLPAGLAQRFVSPAGTWLLRIYARENVWDIEPLAQFVHEVRQVDPEATGSPLQTYEASRQMKSSYERAAAYAFVAIVVLLAFDLRSLRLVLLALVPLAVGVTMLLGTLSLAGIDLNPANMIVLPLILGIGVDNGVYVLHDYQQRRGHYRMSQSTAWAVLLTSMTNIIGFGTLAIADHRGIRSLGLVLVLGMGFCLLASLIFLPALLRWISLRRSNSQRFVHDASAIPPPHHARRADPASAPAEASPQASARAASG
ncbi:MAG: MMPL family transporter, partial [Planctomycetes bacterium]|nr:MMPL family transporter [Planctomycetota bacterium]